MSVSIKYKGAEIASANTDITKTLKTSGKYCEADIEVINTQDGGTPVINPLSVTENGTYTAPSGVDGYSPVTVNVPQEGVDALQYCTRILLGEKYPSENPNLILPLATSLASMFEENTPKKYKSITVTCPMQITSLSYFISAYVPGLDKLTSLTLNISDLSKCTTYAYMLERRYKLTGIYGCELDFTSVTNANNTNFGLYQDSTTFTHIRFKANTLKLNMTMKYFPNLDTDSLVSVANGLQAGAHTITLHATNKTNIAAIMGTVTDGVFTADESGDTTLLSFINNTKGWTVA